MPDKTRRSGIGAIGDVPWGTHFCLFYQTKQDLIDVLVPYFKAGLENNEFCVWVTSEPLGVEDARRSLKRAVRNLDDYIQEGQIEILDYSQWHTNSGEFDADGVSRGWVDKEDRAVGRGFDGLRLTVNPTWLDERDWKRFTDYEAVANRMIGKHRMVAACTYSVDKCRAAETLDVVSNHQFALVRRGGEWLSIGSFERKQAEEALRQSEELYSRIVESIDDGIAVMDRDFHFTYWNRAMEKISKISREELVGSSKRPWDVFPHLAEEGVDEMIRRAMGGEILKREDIPYRLPDGTTGHTTETHFPLKGSSGEIQGVVCVVQDVTERKRVEEEKEQLQTQLFQAQRMEAVGTLAGGIAHDFNNLLTSINGYAELVLGCLGDEDPLRRDVEEIRKSGTRAASLTRQLLAFSRRQMLQTRVLDMNGVVTDMEKMLSRLIGEDISLRTDLEPSLWKIRADLGNMEQVIMNLATNAREAMPDGGTLVVKTENVVLDEQRSGTIPEARAGRFLRLSITDVGLGMGENVIEHIFEPFFSTKGPGEGSGLGLSVVHGIVKQHRGWITAESKRGEGSTFRIYLPATVAEPEEETELTFPSEDLRSVGERVLVVEDEGGVRALTNRVLAENGYVVSDASTAQGAFGIFERKDAEFDLVICDVVLPDLSGVELVRQLLSRKPGIRILMTSGYTGQKLQWSLIQESGFLFLQKPYSPVDLLHSAKAALGTRGGTARSSSSPLRGSTTWGARAR